MTKTKEKRAQTVSAELKRILKKDSDFITDGPEGIELKDFIAITKQWDTDVPAIHTLLAMITEKQNHYAGEWLEIMLADYPGESAPLFADCINNCDQNACDFIKECIKSSRNEKLRENIFKVFDILLEKNHIGSTVKGLFKETFEDAGAATYEVGQYYTKLLKENNAFALGFLSDRWEEHGIEEVASYIEDLIAENVYIQGLVEHGLDDGVEGAEKIFRDSLDKNQAWAITRAKKEMKKGSKLGRKLFYQEILDGDREALDMIEKYLCDLDLYGHTETPEWSEYITKHLREGKFHIIEIVKRAVINKNKAATSILSGLVQENNFFAVRLAETLETQHQIRIIPAERRQLSIGLQI